VERAIIEQARAIVAGHGLVRAVDQLPRGHVRFETEFLYPDRSSVDLFLVQEEPLLAPRKLSDLGQTLSWLSDLLVKPWLSKSRQALLEGALLACGARQEGGALELSIESVEHDLLPGIVLLGQACVRVADLIYTRRSPLQLPFSEDVEEVLVDAELSYESAKELPGRYGKLVRVDFIVSGRRSTSAVMTLSSNNRSAAHTQAEDVFCRWHDLQIPERTEQRVTVFDDRFDTYRDEDLRRLEDAAQLVALSDRSTLVDLLAA
jgi:hypothetical protein